MSIAGLLQKLGKRKKEHHAKKIHGRRAKLIEELENQKKELQETKKSWKTRTIFSVL
jgi:hypothetical protein